MSTPVTERIVLIADTPCAPPRIAARAGWQMSPMFGVIFAHTGWSTAAVTQPVTSSTIAGSCPIAAPMLRSGWPCGHEKLSSRPSQPASQQRCASSCQRSFSYISMIEPTRTRSGYSSFSRLKSSSRSSSGRSLMSSMFWKPTSSPFGSRCLAYLRRKGA